MAEKRTRRRFTAGFKAQAVKRLLEGGEGLSEVATELRLSPGELSAWRTEGTVNLLAEDREGWDAAGATRPPRHR
jgi:transposase-like protein